MYYQTNKTNKPLNIHNNFTPLQNIVQNQLSSTLKPKLSSNTKQENIIQTENSENTINNINPLSKSKDSNSHLLNLSQNNLFSAVEYNDLEKAEQILKNDPSQLNELNDEGISPLHISVIKANLKMINLLLKYGANPNILSEKKKQTPLHLAYLNQNSMTEEILQELKNYNAVDTIYDMNNKKPSDYLNNSYLKKNNNTDDYSSSTDKRQVQSNSNTIMLITNENHFDSFMTTNKEEDNKSNITSTINNNNTIQTPTKLEGSNINENDLINEPNITINSNNKYNTNNTNNTVNSKSDSLNRRQYTFGKEDDYIKFQSKNSDINNNNSSLKNMDINYNNINKNNTNGKEDNDFLEKLINLEKIKEKENSQPISPTKLEPKKIEDESKNELNELNDSLEQDDEELNNNNININKNISKNKYINKNISINKNKYYLNNINIYDNENTISNKSDEKSNYNNTNTNNTNNNIYNVDSFTKNNGLISNSVLTYTDSMNVNGSTPQSKKVSVQATISNSLNSNLKDNIDDIELKLPHTTYNNNISNNETINNENININNINNNIILDNLNLNINPNSNLNIDDIYKRIILKKRDSIIKSHRNCYSGQSKFDKKNIDLSGFNIENNNSMNKNSSFNSINSNKNSENNNMNKTVIHNTSKDNNSSFRNITVIHNNNINGIYDGNINMDENINSKEKELNDNSIALFTTKSQTNKLKPNGLMTNNINENKIELRNNNVVHSRNNMSNNNSFLTNNINSEMNNFTTNNNKNISEFKYMDNSFLNNNIINSNYINNSNDNSNININELINEDASTQGKNILSSLKYWLNSIDLINYYQNFVNNSIIDISILVERMKSYQTKLKYENIESIFKIRKPGHIYRILCRLEVDANLIDNKITRFMLKNSKIFNKNDFYLSGGFDNNANNKLHLLISQDYQCLGCCKANKQFSNVAKNDLKSFLKRYGLLNFYQNFYHNGFESIEYVILQMYGGYPINDDILENCFHVYDEDMRKKILKAIVSEMKKINEFLVSEEYNSYQNLDLIKYENIIFCDDYKNSEDSKIMINNGKNNCSIF